MTNLSKLKELESTGNFLFHGSGLEMEEITPRQASNYIEGMEIPDGSPAVFASPILNYALFMAIFNIQNFPKGFHTSTNGKIFHATTHTKDQLKNNASGFVYVFNKNDFEQRDNEDEKGEYWRFSAITPLEKIHVTYADITFPIEDSPTNTPKPRTPGDTH